MFENFDLVIFDADDTLRECIDDSKFYPLADDEWRLKDDVIESIFKFGVKNKKIGIASNQPGISRGELTESESLRLLSNMYLAAFGTKPEPQAVQYCPHYLDGGCDCRKPMPGMLLNIMKHFDVAPEKTVFIGDREKDRQAAMNAGCDFYWVAEVATKGLGS